MACKYAQSRPIIAPHLNEYHREAVDIPASTVVRLPRLFTPRLRLLLLTLSSKQLRWHKLN